MQNLKENWLVLSKMTWRNWEIFVHKLKNSDFILESKMAKINQKKIKCEAIKSTRFSVKTLLYLGNKWIAQLTKLFTHDHESLFLKYKKISKKVVKLGSFLQCSVHISVGHYGCVWKVNLRILWDHNMKNFQVKCGQCDSIIFPQNIFFWRL